MLVVVEDGDSHALLEGGLHLEARRSRNVLQVDAPKGGLQGLDCRNQLPGIRLPVLTEDLAQANRDCVNVGKALEEDGLALHDWEPRLGANVAKAQDGRAVGDHRHGVALASVTVDFLRRCVDFKAWLRNARSVGKGEVVLGRTGLGRPDLQLPRDGGAVV